MPIGYKKQRLHSQSLFLCWHRAIFPVRRQTSIFATDELNFRVRNGNGWTLVVIDTNFVVANFARSVSAVTVRAAKTAYRFVAPPLRTEPASLGFASVWFLLPKMKLQCHFGYLPDPAEQACLRRFSVLWVIWSGDPCGNRTHVWGVRGPRLNLLTNGPSSARASQASFFRLL